MWPFGNPRARPMNLLETDRGDVRDFVLFYPNNEYLLVSVRNSRPTSAPAPCELALSSFAADSLSDGFFLSVGPRK